MDQMANTGFSRFDRVHSLWVSRAAIPPRSRPRADHLESVLSVKGKKVLHIDRNDHYGGYVCVQHRLCHFSAV